MNIQDWFPLGWTGGISLQSKELSRVFSNTTIQKHHLLSIVKLLLEKSERTSFKRWNKINDWMLLWLITSASGHMLKESGLWLWKSHPSVPTGHRQMFLCTSSKANVPCCINCLSVCVYAQLLSHAQLCNPMDCSLPGSSVHRIFFQARILSFPSPRDIPDPGIETASLVYPAVAGRFFNAASLGKPL